MGICRLVGLGKRYIPTSQLYHAVAGMELTARRNLQHLEKQPGCQYEGDTSSKVRDMVWWGWKCLGPLMLRLTTEDNVKTPPLPEQPQPPPSSSTPKQKCGQVIFPGCPNRQQGPGFRDGQLLLPNGTLIYPKA